MNNGINQDAYAVGAFESQNGVVLKELGKEFIDESSSLSSKSLITSLSLEESNGLGLLGSMGAGEEESISPNKPSIFV